MEKGQLLSALILAVYMLLAPKVFGCCGNYNLPEAEPSKTHLLVFVSSSMPKAVLKSYLVQASIYKAEVIIKGLIDGSFVKTQQFMRSLGDDALFQIDDEAFQRFSIVQVPTILLVKDQNCTPEEVCKLTFDKVSGNISIKHAISLFEREGDVKNADIN